MWESESKKIIPYLVQKGNRPTVEEVITYCLYGELRKTALDFVVYMRENNMSFKLCTSTTRGQKIDNIGYIFMYGPDDWKHSDKHKQGDSPYWGINTSLVMQHEDIIISGDMQNLFWDKITYCINCDDSCAGAKDVTLLGKGFVNVCSRCKIHDFYNPDGETLEGLKQLFVLVKKKTDMTSSNKKTKKTPNPPRIKLTTEQRDKNTPIETLIPVFINDCDVQNAVMDFVAYLRESKLELKRVGVSRWVFKHNKQQILSLFLGRNADWWCKNTYWYIDITPLFLHEYEDSIINIGLQDFVLSNIKYCVNCSLGCFPGKNAVILHAETTGICMTEQFIYFCDPDAEVVAGIKKFMELEKDVRNEI